MASENHYLHFILIPFLAQGHLIPMVDMARLLAHHGVTVTLIVTPKTAQKFSSIVQRSIESGLRINVLQVVFPYAEVGQPEGFESMDMIPSPQLFKSLLDGFCLLQKPIEKMLEIMSISPSCIVSDKYLVWTRDIARKFDIPRIVFDGMSCFSLLCTHNIITSKVYETVGSDHEPFFVPGLPDHIELTRSQLPGAVNIGQTFLKGIREEIRIGELEAYGVVINTFEELESNYVNEYKKIRGENVWCIGPVSAINNVDLDKFDRGNKAAIDEKMCLSWLNSQEPCSVIYVCLGSLSRLSVPQLLELGLGLEMTKRPFIWVTKNDENFEKWASENDFEQKVKGVGLIVKGWAPQVLILSHRSIGAFLTHCGWNSTLEGVAAGVPMITWPMFAEQFYNEKLVVQVLRIGERIGAEVGFKWWEEEKFGVLVRREEVVRAVEEVMDGGERRTRAEKLALAADLAVQEGGSSYLNMEMLIQDIKQQVLGKKK